MGETVSFRTANIVDALLTVEEITDRARTMGLGLVAYPVEDVEALCQRLRSELGWAPFGGRP